MTEVRASVCFPYMTGCQKPFSPPELRRLEHFDDEIANATAEHIALEVDKVQPAPGIIGSIYMLVGAEPKPNRYNNLVKVSTD